MNSKLCKKDIVVYFFKDADVIKNGVQKTNKSFEQMLNDLQKHAFMKYKIRRSGEFTKLFGASATTLRTWLRKSKQEFFDVTKNVINPIPVRQDSGNHVSPKNILYNDAKYANAYYLAFDKAEQTQDILTPKRSHIIANKVALNDEYFTPVSGIQVRRILKNENVADIDTYLKTSNENMLADRVYIGGIYESQDIMTTTLSDIGINTDIKNELLTIETKRNDNSTVRWFEVQSCVSLVECDNNPRNLTVKMKKVCCPWGFKYVVVNSANGKSHEYLFMHEHNLLRYLIYNQDLKDEVISHLFNIDNPKTKKTLAKAQQDMVVASQEVVSAPIVNSQPVTENEIFKEVLDNLNSKAWNEEDAYNYLKFVYDMSEDKIRYFFDKRKAGLNNSEIAIFKRANWQRLSQFTEVFADFFGVDKTIMAKRIMEELRRYKIVLRVDNKYVLSPLHSNLMESICDGRDYYIAPATSRLLTKMMTQMCRNNNELRFDCL